MSEVEPTGRVRKLKEGADPPIVLLVAAAVVLALHVAAFAWIGLDAPQAEFAAWEDLFSSARWFFATLAGVFGVDVGVKAWRERAGGD